MDAFHNHRDVTILLLNQGFMDMSILWFSSPFVSADFGLDFVNKENFLWIAFVKIDASIVFLPMASPYYYSHLSSNSNFEWTSLLLEYNETKYKMSRGIMHMMETIFI